MSEESTTILEMLERLKNDSSWCEDTAVRTRIAVQLLNTIVES